jgi:hypothetical protein
MYNQHTEDGFATFETLFNPNTRTCPIFRTRTDAELTAPSTNACQCW